jgi:hypothetical protein
MNLTSVHVRKFTKFAHELGSVGFTGAIAVHMVLLSLDPGPERLEVHAAIRQAIAGIGDWLLFPSLGLVLFTGLLAIGINRAFHDVGWVWLKLLFGVSVFEGTLVAVHGPAQRAAEKAVAAVSGELDPSRLGSGHDEWMALWVMMFVAVLNIWLGVYRPRFAKRSVGTRPEPAASPDAATG